MKLHITERAIDAITLPEGKRQLLVFDEELSGFAVSISKTGVRSYVIVYRDGTGAQRQEKLAEYQAVSAHAARALARARLSDLAAARGSAPRARRPSCPTVDRFFYDVFLPLIKQEKRSHETHASLYRNHLAQTFGGKRLDDVSEEDVLAFAGALRQKKVADGKWKAKSTKVLSDGTVKRILILLRHVFNVAIRSKSNPLRENPTAALTLSTVRKVKGIFLTKKQLGDLMRAVEESENKDLPDIIRIQGTTGLRRNNVLAMQWDWLNEERGTLSIPAEFDKAKQGFVLHLAAEVLQLLMERRSTTRGPWVFPNPATGKPYASCYSAWDAARKKANLPSLRMHDLRHTFASMMLDGGADIVDVQKALGHTQLKTTAVYLHLTESRKRQYANVVASATGLFA
jgi:integrase